MNKEQIIDEAWKQYLDETMFTSNPKWLEPVQTMNMETKEICWGARQYYREGFINKCKTDQEFSEKWGLKIEERELSLDERINLIEDDKDDKIIILFCENPADEWLEGQVNEILTHRNIPTKLITITDKNKKIEIYE